MWDPSVIRQFAVHSWKPRQVGGMSTGRPRQSCGSSPCIRESGARTAVNAPATVQPPIRESKDGTGSAGSLPRIRSSALNKILPIQRFAAMVALIAASAAVMISQQGALADARLSHNQQVIPKQRVLVCQPATPCSSPIVSARKDVDNRLITERFLATQSCGSSPCIHESQAAILLGLVASRRSPAAVRRAFMKASRTSSDDRCYRQVLRQFAVHS